MAIHIDSFQALDLWRRAIIVSVRNAAPDLTARQTAMLLAVYLMEPPHTVRGLAELLRISKPAVTRGIDRLSDLGLVDRRIDDGDRRSVLIQRTVRGSDFLRDFAELIVDAARETATTAGDGQPAAMQGLPSEA